MTKEEFRQNAAISALQGVIEARYGVLGESHRASQQRMRFASEMR